MSKSPMAPLSAEERVMLNSLLQRLNAQSEDPRLPDESVISADTDWLVATQTSMTDASKRRLDTSPERELRNHGYCAPKTGTPVDAMTCETYGKTKKGLTISLPEGLADLAMWGRSVIEFGKFQSRGWTYSELAESADKEAVSYVKWCKGQVDSSEGLLHDLCLYLWAREYRPGNQLPVIPGTDHVRKLR